MILLSGLLSLLELWIRRTMFVLCFEGLGHVEEMDMRVAGWCPNDRDEVEGGVYPDKSSTSEFG